MVYDVYVQVRIVVDEIEPCPRKECSCCVYVCMCVRTGRMTMRYATMGSELFR